MRLPIHPPHRRITLPCRCRNLECWMKIKNLVAIKGVHGADLAIPTLSPSSYVNSPAFVSTTLPNLEASYKRQSSEVGKTKSSYHDRLTTHIYKTLATRIKANALLTNIFLFVSTPRSALQTRRLRTLPRIQLTQFPTHKRHTNNQYRTPVLCPALRFFRDSVHIRLARGSLI